MNKQDEDVVVAFMMLTLVLGPATIVNSGLPIDLMILAVVLFLMFWAIMVCVLRIANRPDTPNPAKV